MNISSPLRYPGGKSAMAGLLSQIRRLNGLGNRAIAEPFAGGAGASLTLLYLEETYEIHINDAAEWYRQRDSYRDCGRVSRVRRGFSAFYLNRCNRSGIIMNGGPIGGVEQDGNWKLDARFNKSELLRRCEKVTEYHDRIHISGIDGIDFIGSLDSESTLFFIDPPYFVKGRTLYLNAADEDYHVELSTRLKSMTDAAWVLTYDDCPEIRRMYSDWAIIRPFALRYSAAERRSGKEILIVPKWTRLPPVQASAAIIW